LDVAQAGQAVQAFSLNYGLTYNSNARNARDFHLGAQG
jgi:hypothetical protein